MKKINNLTFIFTIIIFIMSVNVPSYAISLKKPADLLKKKEGGGEKFDFKNANTSLVKTFYESSNNYMRSQQFLLIAFEKNKEAAQLEEAIVYSKDAGVNDVKKMKNSIKVSTEASKAIESAMNDKSFQLTAEGKANYAKSLPFLLKGALGTVKLRPEAQAMISNIQGNPMAALKELGGLSKVIPNLPKYIATLTKTTKLVVSGAKAKKIEGSDSLDEAMNDVAL
jgi:hypothetical protein